MQSTTTDALKLRASVKPDDGSSPAQAPLLKGVVVKSCLHIEQMKYYGEVFYMTFPS